MPAFLLTTAGIEKRDTPLPLSLRRRRQYCHRLLVLSATTTAHKCYSQSSFPPSPMTDRWVCQRWRTFGVGEGIQGERRGHKHFKVEEGCSLKVYVCVCRYRRGHSSVDGWVGCPSERLGRQWAPQLLIFSSRGKGSKRGNKSIICVAFSYDG